MSALETLTEDERLALAACALMVSCVDDNLRNLSGDERQVALRGRRNAEKMLMATKISPTELKALGLRLIQA